MNTNPTPAELVALARALVKNAREIQPDRPAYRMIDQLAAVLEASQAHAGRCECSILRLEGERDDARKELAAMQAAGRDKP